MFNKGIIFQGNTRSDWLDISASNPVDIISLSLDDPSKNLVEFVQDNIGKLIAGFISYEYGVNILGVSIKEPKPIPAVHFRAYDAYENYQSVTPENDFVKWAPFEPRISESEYASKFNKIIRHIRSGDIYQLNYTHPLVSQTNADPISLFNAMRQKNEVGYSAFIEDDDWAIHSLSPEQFIVIENGVISTKPIKGTKHRSVFAYEDKELAVSLLESEKDRAENLMIVDLLRNDISKSCESGSVNVPKLFALETYSTVHHLVSTISGTLAKNKDGIDLIRECFPGGSITGAPKLRSMEIIEELEPDRRSIYCGSIAYIGFDGNMDSSICIRTLIYSKNKIHFFVGGGIVWDSTVDAEYKECFDKASAMLKIFERKST